MPSPSKAAEKILVRLSQALASKDFALCGSLSREVMQHGAAVEWRGRASFSGSWAYWHPTDAASSCRTWRRYGLEYCARSLPDRPYQLGGHWTGGGSSPLEVSQAERHVELTESEYAQALSILERELKR